MDKSVLLYQAYQDAWGDYQRSLNNNRFPVWDYIFLTASNQTQADEFEKQVELRNGYLPKRTRIIVVPDEGGLRVGSGGATLSVIKRFFEEESSFEGKKILVIHSGGDSKRIPQYSAIGKLFSPVPHKLPDSRASTLFDEIIISLSAIPGRMNEGMLLISGDALLIFNPLLVGFSGRSAAAISFKESAEVGKEHGVFTLGEDGNVKAFLHKQNVNTLCENGAVDDNNDINIDTGAIILGTDILNSLWGLISSDGKPDPEKYTKFVNNRVRLSLYGDFQYPMASDSTLENFYNEMPEGDFTEELKNCRTQIWQALHNYRIRLIAIPNAKFLHFGTSREILTLVNKDVEEYKMLGWSKCINSISSESAAYNSIVSEKSEVGENCYIENSYIHSGAAVGSGSIVSSLELRDGVTVPENVVLHMLKQKNGKFVCRIFGVDDNPKTIRLFNKEIPFSSLWDAPLYPECDSPDEAVANALEIYEMQLNGRLNDAWGEKSLKSLQSGFNGADIGAVLDWNKKLTQLVEIKGIQQAIINKVPASECKKLSCLTDSQKEWLDRKLEESDFGNRIRLNYYVGASLDGEQSEEYLCSAFKNVSDAVLCSSLNLLKPNTHLSIKKDTYSVSLPLRVNFGGGWTDTPPFCNENGGKVLNAAILLDSKMPVRVTVKRLEEKKIVFESADMGVHGEFTDIKDIQALGDPYDSYALQKAALVACGIIPIEGSDLETVLTGLGGGIWMDTEVVGVPKGSGLGTSSILAAACVKALSGFFEIPYSESDLFSTVLCMEQLMSTGGGWQDQVGGLVGGIKLISSGPGLEQKLNVEQLDVSKNTLDELNQRLILIYTGQRRLARNLLRDVVGRYIGNEPDTVYALNEIQTLALKMRDELINGNVDAFASLLDEHWKLSKMIDSGSTNILIDSIFDCIGDLISGKMICGAGGGGFLQVILKKGATKNQLDSRLKDVFPGSGIAAWNCEII